MTTPGTGEGGVSVPYEVVMNTRNQPLLMLEMTHEDVEVRKRLARIGLKPFTSIDRQGGIGEIVRWNILEHTIVTQALINIAERGTELDADMSCFNEAAVDAMFGRFDPTDWEAYLPTDSGY